MKYKKLTEQPITAMMLNVTDECNLCCPYCFTEPNPKRMSLNTGLKAIKWLIKYNNTKIKNGDKKDSLFISFFGGEPTLYWESFILPLMELTQIDDEIVNTPISWGITTNGQLLNREMIKTFTEKYNGNILLSIDGDRETQNINRPRKDGEDSFQPILESIPDLLDFQPRITFRSTIIPKTVHLLFKNYLTARSLGFSSYFCTPNLREEWKSEEWDILNEQIELIYSQILDDVAQDIPPVNCSFLNSSLKNILLNNYDMEKSHKRCGIGITSVGISTQGDIIGCQEHSTYSKEDLFFIGTLDKGINKRKHLKLIKSFLSKDNFYYLNKEDCLKCKLFSFCQQNTCPSANFNATKNIRKFPLNTCNWNKILAFNAETFLQKIIDSKSPKFIEYLQISTEGSNI
ncbi:MAG: radical SAM protein [Mycoplasmataceae bacterium]|jgi:uncharacterized protein|nr:radical SAM protein [Mycoplasmataceae bacterium]